MRKYKALASIRFGGGEILGLDKELTVERKDHLREVGDGIYQVIDHVCFKTGTVISINKVQKTMLRFLEPIGVDEKEVDEGEVKPDEVGNLRAKVSDLESMLEIADSNLSDAALNLEELTNEKEELLKEVEFLVEEVKSLKLENAELKRAVKPVMPAPKNTRKRGAKK